MRYTGSQIALLVLAALAGRPTSAIGHGGEGQAVLAADSAVGIDATLDRELLDLWLESQDSSSAHSSAHTSALTWADASGLQLARGSAAGFAPTGDGECFGLPKANCKPCPSGETNMCSSTEKQCKDIHCTPLCLSLAWSCEVKVGKGKGAQQFGSSMADEEKRALCAQFVGQACSKIFSCCKADAALTDWVEGFSFAEQTASPLLPIGPCLHDPSDEKASKSACSACKGAISLDLKATPERCVFGSPKLASKAGGGGKGKKKANPGGGSFKSLEERVRRQSRLPAGL
jgi:hypothetical protein